MIFFKKKAALTNKVIEYYNAWTDKYIAGFGDTFQSKRADNLDAFYDYYLKSIGIKKGDNVLDAGCGIGGPLSHLSRRVDARFTGLNVVAKQIEIAKEKVQDAPNRHNIEFQLGDFHKLTSYFTANSFDVVYFMESLVHSNNTKQVLTEAYKVLKSNGTLYIKDLFEKTAFSANEKSGIKKSIEINNKLFVLDVIPKEQLLFQLRDIGFELIFLKQMELETNQDVGNAFVVNNGLVSATTDWHPYLEWYEIKCIKPAI